MIYLTYSKIKGFERRGFTSSSSISKKKRNEIIDLISKYNISYRHILLGEINFFIKNLKLFLNS